VLKHGEEQKGNRTCGKTVFKMLNFYVTHSPWKTLELSCFLDKNNSKVSRYYASY
jgi:hypothetical protein